MNKPAEKKKGSLFQALLLTPYSVWALLFILVPLVFIAYYAFTDNSFHFTMDNIAKFFTARSTVTGDDGVKREVLTYLLIFWRSLRLAIISTIICLVMGFPIAYIIARSDERAQKIMIMLIMIPMWMNFLIRTYAWMTILQDTGILNSMLAKIGLNPVHIIGTEGAVVIGMVYDYIPYMILPIYSILCKLDGSLLEAAHDLGCNNLRVMEKVVIPFSLPGIVSGITMVLIPSISTFYISQKLGNGKFYLIGDAIEGQYTANNLHFAAAIAFIIMIVLLAGMALMQYYTAKRSNGGAE